MKVKSITVEITTEQADALHKLLGRTPHSHMIEMGIKNTGVCSEMYSVLCDVIRDEDEDE